MDRNQALSGGLVWGFVGMEGLGVVREKENHYPSVPGSIPESVWAFKGGAEGWRTRPYACIFKCVCTARN